MSRSSFAASQRAITAAYSHYQDPASPVWAITHRLGFPPSVSAFDTFGNQLHGAIRHVDADTLTITFNTSREGVAHLS